MMREIRQWDVRVLVRNNETGEVREAEEDWEHEVCSDEDDHEEPFLYVWTDGNYSCDCNRGLFFGEDETECGDSGYSVNLICRDSGRVLYREFEEVPT